ncbi:DUF123 domain-containing protein [Salinarchaeum chitinilyticum]
MGDPERSPATADATHGGTYSLLVELPEPTAIEIGALGEIVFEAGQYAYTGSAFGPGGFARIDRHRELAAGERDVRHWHVDYLLGQPDARIESVWISPGADRECAIAGSLPGDAVAGFGASDCDCETHLVGEADGAASPGRLRDALADRHDRRLGVDR